MWQPIDTAPRDGTRILLWWPSYAYSPGEPGEPYLDIGHWKENGRIGRGYFSDNYEFDDYALAETEHAPTHWMPIPGAPE